MTVGDGNGSEWRPRTTWADAPVAFGGGAMRVDEQYETCRLRGVAGAGGSYFGPQDLPNMGGLELHPATTAPARAPARGIRRVRVRRLPPMPHTHKCRLCDKTGTCQPVADKLAPRLSWQVRNVHMSGHLCKAGDKYITFRTEADLMPNMAAQFEWNLHTARLRRELLVSSAL